jgi:hypothetical protein
MYTAFYCKEGVKDGGATFVLHATFIAKIKKLK